VSVSLLDFLFKAHFIRDIRQLKVLDKVNGNKVLASLKEEYDNLK
jgi:hypothetical protein